MPTTHYLNLNYVCNERCVFCASDLTNQFKGTGARTRLDMQQIRAWIAEQPPKRGDQVMFAGGEPTLHPDLFEIATAFAAHCKDITLFTNAVKLADPSYATGAVEAGITSFEVALFGASPATHDAITRRPRSFEQTLVALRNLARLREGRRIDVVVRLLAARHCHAELPDIVRVVRREVPGVTGFSINRLIHSEKARDSDAMVSWAEALPAINEAATLIREGGYAFVHWPVPLCLFRGDNAEYVDAEIARLEAARPLPFVTRYLDPLTRSKKIFMRSSTSAFVEPEVCRECRIRFACSGIEQTYYDRFGTAGLGLDYREHA